MCQPMVATIVASFLEHLIGTNEKCRDHYYLRGFAHAADPTWALWGPQGPQEGGAPPWALWGPQGPQEGTGSLPGGSPGQGEHGEEVRDDF